MKHSDYIAYFHGLATQFGLSFYTYGLDEFIQHLDNVQYPCMLLQRYSYRMSMADVDSKYKVRNIGFMVVDNLKNPDNYTEMNEIFDSTEELADSIIIQINNDANDYSDNPAVALVRGSVPSSVNVIQVENMADNNFGVFVSLDIISEFY